MHTLQPTPQQVCEGLLVEGRRYNIERSILPSENAVTDRLLARGIELKDAYAELHEKLSPHPPALKVFIDLLLSTAAFWNPEKMARARTARSELASINAQIAQKARELAALLERRSDLHDNSGFSSDTHYHVCDVIEAASKNNHRFNAYVKDRLDDVRGQFDFKYWPSLDQFMQVLADDAQDAEPEATDPLTAAATAGARPSRADFFKALFAAIEDNGAQNHGLLPASLRLTDGTLASLANCALGLGSAELVDSAHVKRLRQRQRNGGR